MPSLLYYCIKYCPIFLYLFVPKFTKINPIAYPIPLFLHPPTHAPIPLFPLHFPPFLPTFIHPPIPLWKMWKTLLKTCHFRLWIPNKPSWNTDKCPKTVLGYPLCFFLVYFLFTPCSLDILIVVFPIYWEPMVPIPSFARKDFQSFLLVPSLRSGRRQTVFHLSNLTVLKWRNRLRRVVILKGRFRIGNERFNWLILDNGNC